MSNDTNKIKYIDNKKNLIIIFLYPVILKKYNSEIIHATSGYDAIKICKNNIDIDLVLVLVLMDINMLGMDGYETTRQIRKFNKDIIIIAQTARAFLNDKDDAINAGCNDYISKPIDAYLLIDTIQQYFSFN